MSAEPIKGKGIVFRMYRTMCNLKNANYEKKI